MSKALVFGSKEANELLTRETGRRFDLADVDPLSHRHNPELDAPDEDDDTDRYCTTCGGYMDWVDCWQCGGEGGRDGEELMMEDPLWYCEDDFETCDICNGAGGYWECGSLPHDEVAT